MIDTLAHYCHFLFKKFSLFFFFTPPTFDVAPVYLYLFVSYLVGLDAHDVGAVLLGAPDKTGKIDVNGFLNGIHEAAGFS